MKWNYGITCVPQRKDDLLRKTIASLAAGGFDQPRLFIDGERDGRMWREQFGLDVTARDPKIRTYGNWLMALVELYIREPSADRYAIFQDDIEVSKNLRSYLNHCAYPETGYWNLCTYPINLTLGRGTGWFLSNQRGMGAQALVFDRKTIMTLLTKQEVPNSPVDVIVERPQDAQRGWRNVDGAVVFALKRAGWREWCHNPGLVNHTGRFSTMQNPRQPKITSFCKDASTLVR